MNMDNIEIKTSYNLYFDRLPVLKYHQDNTIHMEHEGFSYELYVETGTITKCTENGIAIQTEKRNLVCWAVNAEGFFVGQCPIRYEDGYAIFRIGGEFSSIYYFIQEE